MSDLIPLDKIGKGWNEKESHSTLKSGDFSLLLKECLGNRLRWNELTLLAEIDGKEIPEIDLDHLHVKLSENGWTIGKDLCRDAFIYRALQNSYHPIQEELKKLENDPKELVGDINNVCTNYLGVSDQLSNSMMAACLIALVKRVFEPGCKFDNCIVLKGEQGIGKSTWWRTLVGDKYFCDTPQDNEKDLKLMIQTCWLYEFQELESVTSKKEVGALKALLSSPVDHFRKPYTRRVERCKRPSIIVGTVNPDTFLKDPTGNRRFWVIPLPKAKKDFLNISKLKKDRNQILKSALVAYRNGRQPILTQAEQIESNIRNIGFEEENVFLEPLSNWLNHAGYQSPPEFFTTHQAIVDGLNRDKDKIKPNDIKIAADALRKLGCKQDQVQKRRNGEKKRWWHLPEYVSMESGYVRFLGPEDFAAEEKGERKGLTSL